MTPQDRLWISYFLTETRVRIFLQSLFVALVGSGENCATLLSKRPDEITWEIARGSELARKCLLGVSRWLHVAEQNSSSTSLFQSQLLEPARAPARFMQAIRQLSQPTTSLSGIVFAKSAEFFDKDYDSKVVSLSIIVPSLERTLSLRCRPETMGTIRGGPCKLDGVQPLPFMNRIHPVRLRIDEEQTAISLASLDFLKLSLFDLKTLTRSMAFENYSEVQSSAEGIRRMGVTGVIGGTLLFVRPPFLTIRSSADPAITARVLISNEMVDGTGGSPRLLRGWEGKPVRILCTAWYEPRKDDFPSIEGFSIRPAENATDVVADDILGYIRVRKKVTAKELQTRFQTLPSTSTRLKEQNDTFEWTSRSQEGKDVIGEFSKCEGAIATLRATSYEMWQASPDSVFDPNRLNLTSVAERISRNGVLMKSANAIVRTRDLDGTLPKTRAELEKKILELEPGMRDPCIWWFRLMGLVSKNETGFTLTRDGMQAIERANRKELTSMFDQRLASGQRLFSLVELDGNARFPSSLILYGLGELAKEGRLVRTKDDLVWSAPNVEASELSGPELQLEILATKVLSILQSVHHALGTLRIVEILREQGDVYSDFTLNIFLRWMKKQGIVKELEGGGWFYTWEDRIRNSIRAYSPRYYTVDQVASLCSLPLNRQEILRILSALVKEGVVEEVLPSMWGARLDAKGTQERNRMIMEGDLKSYIRANLRGRFAHENLVERVEYIILARLKPSMRAHVDYRQLARKLVRDMIASGELVPEGDFLRIS